MEHQLRRSQGGIQGSVLVLPQSNQLPVPTFAPSTNAMDADGAVNDETG